MTKFDYYEFTLGNWWSSAIFNGDYSGLNDEEIAQLESFMESAIPVERRARGHWDGFSEEDSLGFCRDDVTGLGGDCYKARFYFPMEG